MGLRDVGASLPPGFRFYPSDEELVCHYLYKKVTNEKVLRGTLVEIDLHTCEPWQLPEVAKLNSNEWYFFSFRDRKYATGFRTNRATISGYWKATGKDRTIHDPRTRAIVGMRKTLVFYRNRAPNGIKTGWIMHEFRLENPQMPPKEDWVLCRVFQKTKQQEGENSNKLSPQNVFESSATIADETSPATNNQQSFPCGCHQTTITSFSQSPPHHHHQNLNLIGVLNPNLLQSSQEEEILNNNPPIISTQVNSNKCIDDEFGFLFFEDTSLGNEVVVSPSLGEMRFDDGNSLVFL